MAPVRSFVKSSPPAPGFNLVPSLAKTEPSGISVNKHIQEGKLVWPQPLFWELSSVLEGETTHVKDIHMVTQVNEAEVGEGLLSSCGEMAD